MVPRAHAGNQSHLFPAGVGRVSAAGVERSGRCVFLGRCGCGAGAGVLWRCVSLDELDSGGLAGRAAAALDRNCIFYSQEARPYACVQLVGLGQLLLFWSMLTTPTRWRRVGFVAISWVLFYLHYTSALLIAGELLAYMLLAMRSPWRPAYRPTQLVLDLGAWLLGCLPAMPHLVEIAARRTNWQLFIPRQPFWGVWTIFPLSWYVVLPAAVCSAAWGYRVLRRSQRQLPRRRHRCHTGERGAPPVPTLDLRSLILVLAWLFVP